MVKLVGVYQGGTKSGTGECKARRYMPLEIEPDLTMVMALEEFCLACGSGPSTGSKKLQSKTKMSDDVEIFKRNYASLDKDELSAALMVTWRDVLPSMAQTVSCVGCRRSIEHLFHSIKESSGDCSLDPLLITKDGIISISKEHVQNPNSLSNLLCHQISRLQRRYIDGPAFKKTGVKKGGRCALHLLEQKKVLSGSWLDSWDVMEPECKDEVVLLPFSSIRATLDKYLKKHSFCCECATMINKAFTYLIEEGRDPAKVDENGDEIEYEEDESEEDERQIVECEEKEDREVVNEDGTLNLFSGVSPCVSDEHVHITRNPNFISQLLLLAEPELSGLDQERHAKNMETAQKEVLTCIGITLFNRFHKIQQRLREGEQTCDLLSLVALISLRKSFDICIERKRGILDLDALCFQIEQSDRDRERRQARKREKKIKNQQKKREIKAVLEREENEGTLITCDHEKEWKESKSEASDKTTSKDNQTVAVVNSEAKDASTKGANSKKKPKEKKKGEKRSKNESGARMKNVDNSHDSGFRGRDHCGVDENDGADSDSGLSCVWSGDTSPLYVRSEGRYEQGTWIKGGSPDLGLGEGEGAKHHCTASKQGPVCNEQAIRHPDMVMPSLEELLETGDSSEEGMEEDAMFISAEEMKEFQSMFPQLNSQREQLRKNLREKFAALCVNGAKNCGKPEQRGN